MNFEQRSMHVQCTRYSVRRHCTYNYLTFTYICNFLIAIFTSLEEKVRRSGKNSDHLIKKVLAHNIHNNNQLV